MKIQSPEFKNLVFDLIFWFGMTPDEAIDYAQNFPNEAVHRLEILRQQKRSELITKK